MPSRDLRARLTAVPVETDHDLAHVPTGDEETEEDVPWIVLVWNDPINLMEYVTFVFQQYSLYPHLSVYDNIAFPLRSPLRRITESEIRRKVGKVAEMLHIESKLERKATALSGGEMQRTAIARALITGPKVLLADEPTGNLDRAAGQEILKILRSLNERENLTIVMVTHDLAIAEQADRIVRLTEGRVER